MKNLELLRSASFACKVSKLNVAKYNIGVLETLKLIVARNKQEL